MAVKVEIYTWTTCPFCMRAKSLLKSKKIDFSLCTYHLFKIIISVNSHFLFWGKITTTSTPYYIALAIDFKGQYGFPHKKFFYRYVFYHAVETISNFKNYQHSMSSIKTMQINLTLYHLLAIPKQSC